MLCTLRKSENYKIKKNRKKNFKIPKKQTKISKKQKNKLQRLEQKKPGTCYKKIIKNRRKTQKKKNLQNITPYDVLTKHRNSLCNPQPSNYSQDGPDLKICHYNVQGLNCQSKQALLAHWIYHSDIDIFAIAEVKLSKTALLWMEKNFLLPKYVIINSTGESHFGVSIIIKKELEASMKFVAEIDGKALYIKIENLNSISVNLIYLYNSFRPFVDALFEDTIHEWIEDCKDSPTMIFGDFNQSFSEDDRSLNGQVIEWATYST